jgi:prepilin-type N-terminal cleavage/methylation domain-containing protein
MMKKNIHLTRQAFTMIELVFVIIVMGVLAALAMPRLNSDKKQEAMDNILSDIRYTQHLALMGSKQMFNNEKWQQRYWRIVFSDCGGDYFYMIGTDDDMESANNAFFSREEAATDPANGKPMFYACNKKVDKSNRIFLTDKYGITSILAEGGCTGNNNGGGGSDHIGFDHLGRAHHDFSASTEPNYDGYMYDTCTLTFTFDDGNTEKITIAPETGYATIVGQPDS